MSKAVLKLRGVEIHKAYLDAAAQRRLVEDVRGIVRAAPLARPVTPGGRQMSVRMTSAGRYGWVTDRSGYRYERNQPDGRAWPEIPASVLEMWSQLASDRRAPDCCLVNFYDGDARMGMHQDRDEGDFDWPVLSVSLGDSALFRVGNTTRGGKTETVWLESGDVLIMGGAARLIHHGIDRIRPGSSTLLPRGGRINLTLRVVD